MKKWTRIKFQPCMPLGEDGKRVTGCREHIEFSRKAASEGMVLLKNDGVLPLAKGTKVAVFGKAQIDYVKGGGGSGDVHCAYVRNIDDGLRVKEAEGKLSVFDKTAQFYKDNLKYDKTDFPGYSIEPELPESLLKEAAEFADTAIITICRFSGENWDRSATKGDFYLNDEEEKMIKSVCSAFKKVVAVLDVGGMVDSAWFKDNDAIGGALLAWNGGMEGGLAIADILTGDVNPSGKLVDTFAKSFDDYPSSATYHNSAACVKYYDDIYVGYRYFETIPGASEKVNYPFGFGLSYTTFDFSDITVSQNGEKIDVKVTVTNSGAFSGREVVQVYYSAPSGKLGKPKYELAAFKKTSLLAPGASEVISLGFDISSMASYDDCGKLCKSAFILEQGDYEFYIGNSVRNTVKADFTYSVNEEFRVINQLTAQMVPRALEKRLCADGTYEALTISDPQSFDYVVPESIPTRVGEKIMFSAVADGKASLDDFIAQFDMRQMLSLLGGKDSTGVANTGGMGGTPSEKGVDEYGIPCAMTCDGPAGVRINPECGVKTTAFPCATLLACTWDTDILHEIGKIGALEAKENNMAIWLTPALNIHRSPLCGRNFEYFSEDPLIAGKMAAAKVNGIQSQNIAASAKHFACNNKETNRFDSDSIVSERALREIYLKGFEICVKESSPWTIMSSYNLINGVRASENYDMLTNILRNEWGYTGMVTTDWDNHGSQRREIMAGNDVRMPYGNPPHWFPNGIPFLQQSLRRLLEMLLKLD